FSAPDKSISRRVRWGISLPNPMTSAFTACRASCGIGQREGVAVDMLVTAATKPNIEAGQEISWLPRRLASRIALPGNDFWLFDGERVLFNLFTGDGDWAGQELTDDSSVVALCRSAFEAVW